jgi:tetratricopeptide (TPR) repeat protein
MQGNAAEKIVLISAVALLAHAFFNFPFYIIDTKFYFFALLGTGLGGGNGEKPGRDTLVFILAAPVLLAAFLLMLCGSVYLNYGINASQSGGPGAGNMLERAVRFYPGVKKYYYMAEWKMKLKDYEAAALNSRRYIDAMPLSKTGNIQAGIIAAEAGDLTGAIRRFDIFLKYYPKDIDMLNNKGKALFLSGRRDDAIEVYNSIILIEPLNDLAHRSLLAIYNDAGMKAKAAAEINRRRDEVKTHGAGRP